MHFQAELHYFVCKRIFEILENSDEAKEKNLFGQYSSQRLKAWQDIVKSYESGAVYLGEAAQLLINYVKYEMYVTCSFCPMRLIVKFRPAAKRKLERCKKQVEELGRKEIEQAKAVKDYNEKFKKSCAAAGIEVKPQNL